MNEYGRELLEHHAQLLRASAISPERAADRGYRTVEEVADLETLNIARAGRRVPGLLVPNLRADGSVWGYQYRPDEPRLRAGKSVKYETPVGQRNRIDVPPGVGPNLADPAVPLWITEGARKADAAAQLGLACVSLAGVWGWRGTSDKGGKVALADWHDIALNDRKVVLAFDSDVVRKPEVAAALAALAEYLKSKGATVSYCHLPDDNGKTGLDDFIAAGHDQDDLLALVRPDAPRPTMTVRRDTAVPGEQAVAVVPRSTPPLMTLTEAHEVFTRWLGNSYDLQALDAVLAAAAVEQLDGDPVWLLLLSGSGNAKTETVSALQGAGAIVTSTIASEGALLSGTASKDTTKTATGGLLCKIGARGLVVIKDFTSILSMGRDPRASVIAALREVHDGRWERNLGTDGGKTLTWQGRIVVIGAVTSAYDSHHAVIASMGDRFAVVRVDSNEGRLNAGRHALCNVGDEEQMRAELAAAVGGVLAGLDSTRTALSVEEMELMLRLANLVTIIRTAVDRDVRSGEPMEAHLPEAPTRFAKMLAQLDRGIVALGAERGTAVSLVLRVAADSVPPARMSALREVLKGPARTATAIARALNRPRTSVERTLKELHLLRVVALDGDLYTVDRCVDLDALRQLITRNVTTGGVRKNERAPAPPAPADIPGDGECVLCGATALTSVGGAEPRCGSCLVAALESSPTRRPYVLVQSQPAEAAAM